MFPQEEGAAAPGGDDEKFDEFMGSDAGMFAGGTYDEDDKEADRVWDSIDNFMDERRRVSGHILQSYLGEGLRRITWTGTVVLRGEGRGPSLLTNLGNSGCKCM